MIEHPGISRALKTGYANMIDQPEHNGIDVFDEEILSGDEIAIHDGEIILKSNLEDYLEEKFGFRFTTAE